MSTLLITLIAIAVIGFIWGGFIALILTIITTIIGYFTGLYGALTIVVLMAIGSLSYKFYPKVIK